MAAPLKFGIKWDGLPELKRDLSTFAKDLTAASRPIALRIAADAASEMHATYPRRAGVLKREYPPPTGGPLADGVRVTERKTSATRSSVSIKNMTYYARFVEDGTKFMDPIPVFWPIFFRKQRELVAAITDDVFPAFNLRASGE